MCKKNIKSDKNKSKLTYYLRAVGPENLSIAWHFLTKMILYNVVSDRENKSERPVDALAVKTSLSHLLTTWNQEMLAHLKIPQLLASRLLMLLFFWACSGLPENPVFHSKSLIWSIQKWNSLCVVHIPSCDTTRVCFKTFFRSTILRVPLYIVLGA